MPQHNEVPAVFDRQPDPAAFALASGKGEEARLVARDRLNEIIALNDTQLQEAQDDNTTMYETSRALLIGIPGGVRR